MIPLAPLVVVFCASILAGCGDGAAPATAPAAPVPDSAPKAAAAPAASAFLFTDTAEAAGLRAVAWCGRPEKPHLLESGGAGVALFDYDLDGDLDCYVVTSWRLEGDRVVERPPNRLYRNRSDGTFDDVTDASGAGDTGWGTGVAVGDFDGDARPDLFVSNFGADVLLRNAGDGTFTRVENGPGIDGWSAGACFFDADRDGDDDLFVAGYIDCTESDVLHAQPTLDWKNTKVMFGPFGLKGKANRFFRNDGGRYVEATDAAGLTDVGEFFSFGVAACDFDLDGDLDLYVANDSNPNYLYRNDGKGRFEEVGLWCGAALSAAGEAQAGMGVGVGDYDGNGLPDILVTNFADDFSTLYKNLGRTLFRDVSRDSGVREPTFAPLSWGVVFADFDLDADEDVFIANGHIYPQADTTPGTGTTWAQRNLLLANTAAHFKDATADAGPGLAVVRSSRGVASGDVDGDGDVDLVVSNMDATPSLLRNDSPRADRHWLLVDAPGALRVTVEQGARKQTRHFVAGGSFCSASDSRFHFGLGSEAAGIRVTVRQRDGSEQSLESVTPDSVLRVIRAK